MKYRAFYGPLLALLAWAAPALGQTVNLPANTVWGRLGVGTGPGQAIPFSVLTTPQVCAGNRLAKTAAYPVANTDKWKNISLGGTAYYALTFAAGTDYDSNFSVCVLNEDATRAKSIVLTGGSTFKLWPGQSVIIYNSNSVWQTLGRGRWKTPGGGLNMYADFTNGNDSNDCLATGTGACKTVQGALYTLCDQFDFTGTAGGQTQIAVNLASSTTDTTGVHFSCPLVGAQGGAALTISGGTNSAIAAVGLDAIGVFINATIQVQNVTLSSTTGAAISAGLGARIYILGGVTFGATPSAPHITVADPGSHVIINGNYTISGGAPEHYLAQNMASIQCVGPFTATWSANANFSFVFALAGTMGLISCPNMTYTPGAFTATGKRYEADNLSMIYTGGGGANYFPGNSAGTTTSGGTYN